MPTEILVNSIKFYDQLKSGAGFGSLADPTDNLASNIGEPIRVVMEVDIRWYFSANVSNTILAVNGTAPALMLTRQTGSFVTDGFCPGDTLDIYDSTVSVWAIATITAVNDLVMNVNVDTGAIPDATYDDFIIAGTTPLTALLYKFGLIGNTETFNCISKVSENEQVAYASGIGTGSPRSTGNIEMHRLGNFKDWISYKNNVNDDILATISYVSTSGMWQRFKITHTFIVSPFFIEEYETFLDAGLTPALFAGLNTIKYALECEFRTVLSNPNTSKIARVDNILGSVGWFNENFNGFNDNYSIDSIAYEDTTLGTPCSGLQSGARTTATVTVSKLLGSFNAGDPCSAIVALMPRNTAYINTLTTQDENFLYDVAYAEEGAGSGSNYHNIIKEITCGIVAGKLVITLQIEYNTTQQVLIESGARYIIGVQVADDTLSSGNSDKVMLLADVGDYIASADIEDLAYVTDLQIYQHPYDPSVDVGATKFDMWNEDGICAKFDFWIDLAKSAYINSLSFAVIAYNSTTEDYFILDNFALNLNSQIISGGVQQININDVRGYRLNATDYFNKVVLTTGAQVSQKQYYQLIIGAKIPWQSWLLNTGADTVFYDSSKPNNNLNYKSSNYSNLNDYQIKIALIGNIAGVSPLGISGNTNYLMQSPDLLTYDYNLPTTWVGTLETFDETGTVNLGGAIRTDADTLMRVTWVRDDVFRTGYDFWAIHRIEESQENGFNIYEFSSIITPISGNLLKPVAGETLLKVTVTPGSNTVVTECLIDHTRLTIGVNYKISARLDDGLASGSLPDAKKTEDDFIKITEDGQTKELE
jgi:hypothetical protein